MNIPWDQLRTQLAGLLETSLGTRGAFATDASVYQVMPLAVAYPRDDNDVQKIVAFSQNHGIPIIGRGGGTSLSGQAIGAGIVVDFTRFMNQVLHIDVEKRQAIVQPGVVLDELNEQLAKHGLQFSPDPATSSRATIGGMIGNNACGTRSIYYGRTCDAIESLHCILADGTWFDTEWLDAQQWQVQAQANNTLGRLYRELDRLVSDHQELIASRIPDLPRNAAGYSLRPLLATRTRRSLSSLIVGGEGTLGLVTRATLRLDPVPRATVVVLSRFPSIDAALCALPSVLASRPSAVELLDELLLGEAQRNASTRDRMRQLLPLDDTPQAILLVEFIADSIELAQQAAAEYVDRMSSSGWGGASNVAHQMMVDRHRQQQAWEVRKLALGLVSNLPGAAKAIALIEDACIPIDKLPEYNRFVFEQGERWDLGISAYAHASVGVLHYKVMLDLHQSRDRQAMRAVAEACFEKCCEVGGVFSGEHGDGIVRGEFLPRQFGEEIYGLFVHVKRLFDPENRMNPGRKINAPPLDRHLRYGDQESDRLAYQQQTQQVTSHFRYERQEGLVGAIEQCNGVGACRQNLKGTMCPSYRATRDERDSTRGRANLLRLAISGQLQPPGLANPELHQSLDLCLACKACKSECPNAVDMAKLKSEALQAKWDREGIAPLAKFLGRAPQNIARLSRWGGPLRHLSNFSGAKRWLQYRYQIDARRSLPIPQSQSFDRWWQGQSHPLKLDWQQLVRPFRQHAPSPDSSARKDFGGLANSGRRHEPRQVALFVDTWHRYLDPHIPQQIVKLLWSLNVAVAVPPYFDALRSRLSWGLLRESKALGEPLLAGLGPLAQANIPLLMIDPSEASALIDDLPDLVSDREQAQRVAAQVQMVDAYVAELIAAEQLSLGPSLPQLPTAVKIHPHCHHRALFETEPTRAILQAAGYNASITNWGCCGMAGSFGYTHYDLSMQIAELRFAPMIRQADGQSEIVVTTGTSCRHQALDTTAVKTYHWAELVQVSGS